MNINNQELYEFLRERRNEIAKGASIKPFMVLHNSVLVEIAEKKPPTIEKLAEIKGMGQKRLERYGEFILETINGSFISPKPKKEEGKIYSVSEFIDFINELLIPERAVVRGEINQVKSMDSYTFFTLVDKNEKAALNCFVWQAKLNNLGVELKEGLEIKIEGFPKIYKKKGQFNFEVENIGLVGEGALKQAFDALKKKLATDGYFNLERKKPIHEYIRRIGLITSTYGDAKNDFLTHLGKYGFEIYFCNVHVEGLYAIDEITSAIRWFNENSSGIEALVITRGGGNLESLQAFNSEAVAKAIYGSKIPVVTGIGHENDETIADLVADRYGSTPTDAARILSDPWRGANSLISSYSDNIISALLRIFSYTGKNLMVSEDSLTVGFSKHLSSQRRKTSIYSDSLSFFFSSVTGKYRQIERSFLINYMAFNKGMIAKELKINDLMLLLGYETNRWLKFITEKVRNEEQRLNLMNPEFRLKQGYSIAFDKLGQVVKDSTKIKVGEDLKLRFHLGSADTRVEKVN